MQDIRKDIRRLRRSLSAKQHKQHAIGLARNLQRLLHYKRCTRIAFYLSADGEIDLQPAIRIARSEGKRCFLPVLRPMRVPKLWFVEYESKGRLKPNRFSIPEPKLTQKGYSPPWGLDAIIMPLVAFDEQCNRTGMGGGFYDRSLSYLNRRSHWTSPLLIGVGHELQKTTGISVRPWDIPLDMVVTETRIYKRA